MRLKTRPAKLGSHESPASLGPPTHIGERAKTSGIAAQLETAAKVKIATTVAGCIVLGSSVWIVEGRSYYKWMQIELFYKDEKTLVIYTLTSDMIPPRARRQTLPWTTSDTWQHRVGRRLLHKSPFVSTP